MLQLENMEWYLNIFFFFQGTEFFDSVKSFTDHRKDIPILNLNI